MGVTQLWTVLQPAARPTRLETLNRKRLAVDASIWIYQFLKAVRDKEGEALRNSHVVGFFRRICKLLFFGIKPVFVFDGGAPTLKRQTILNRKRRREGRREDAARTAGRLFAIQMQRRAEDEEERRKRQIEVRGRPVEDNDEEKLPDEANLVYTEELGMSQQERQRNRKFVKKDPYHLPDLSGGIEAMGQPDDPRIMSLEELQEFSRQHSSGENIDVYDFSKIDFDGEFFKSLPAVDRYNILNAARLRSRLRMGLSKEQLEEIFPDRMAFSRFQVERVRERNELTQRLMNLNGMNSDDAMFGVGSGRIAGERGREYILVKNDGVEGGWALGVVSVDKDVGKRNKPIDIDAMTERENRLREAKDESDDDDEFEDVPVEGLNRLPKFSARQLRSEIASRSQPEEPLVDWLFEEESLFVDQEPRVGTNYNEEDELKRAIAMSLGKNFHVSTNASDDEDDAMFEDVPISIPKMDQMVVDAPAPIRSTGKGLSSIINKRSNTAAKNVRAVSESDDEENLQDILAVGRRQRAAQEAEKKKNGEAGDAQKKFGGPLPFERLNLGPSLFNSRKKEKEPATETNQQEAYDLEGGFDKIETEAPLPLPPWLTNDGDIRAEVKQQQSRAQELDAQDFEIRQEEEARLKADREPIEVMSSDDDSDFEMSEVRPICKATLVKDVPRVELDPVAPLAATAKFASAHTAEKMRNAEEPSAASGEASDQAQGQTVVMSQSTAAADTPVPGKVASPQQEAYLPVQEEEQQPSREYSPDWRDNTSDMDIDGDHPDESGAADAKEKTPIRRLPQSRVSLSVDQEIDTGQDDRGDGSAKMPKSPAEVVFERQQEFAKKSGSASKHAIELDMPDEDYDHYFSDPEEEELMAQLDAEAEEHARFASTLNHKPAHQNQAEYEQELKQLRNQQKKDRRDADEVSHVMVTECQALLRLFGLPYITAPMEAEAQCAKLVSLGLVDGIVTDDSDIFLFGGTRVYKNLFNSSKFVECYLASDLEKELSLSRDKLIEFAHLLGSDYTEGLPGIGPVTALEIISEFPSKDGLQQFRDWWFEVQHNQRPKEADAKSPFRRKFRRSQATKLFLPPGFPSQAVTEAYLHPDVDATPDPFQWGVPNLDNLRSFLMATIGWSQERTDEVLLPVIKDMNRREAEGTQSNITRYFEGAVGAGARAGTAAGTDRVGSNRMRAAMDRLKAQASGASDPAISVDDGTPATAAQGNTWRTPAKRSLRDGESAEGALENEEAGAVGSAAVDSKGRGKRAKTTK